MEHLGNSDLRALLDFLHESSAFRDLDGFRFGIPISLSRLIPAESVSYDEVLAGVRAAITNDHPEARFPEMDEVLARHATDHPLIVHYADTRDGRALKISDFIDRSELHRRELYQSLFRRVDTEYQIAFALPARAPLIIGIALSRKLRDFSEGERLILDLVRPHLSQIHRTVALLSEMSRAGEDAGRSLISVNGRGQVQGATDRARRWLAAYFGEPPGSRDRLPSKALFWLRRQQARLASVDAVPALAEPLVVRLDKRQLTVRLVPRPSVETEDLLILEERAVELGEEDLVSLGLTRREAEVLKWVSQGKTDSEIAGLLVTSPRTVQAHLAHIYTKLDVRTRTAAAARAFQAARGGLLDLAS